jgi:NAD(P)-dependent dehydrogenase (short-subunit alcohol dehydrogenase family)
VRAEPRAPTPAARLSGHVAIVTGGIAVRFASEGAATVVADVNESAARDTVDNIVAAGGTAVALAVDVAQRSQLDAMVSEALAKFGKIDILVNSAGVNQTRPWLDLTEPEWDWLMGINLRGLFFSMQAVARHMIPRRTGKILNIASLSGKRGTVTGMHYSASKAGVLSVTRTVALALAPYAINVNALCPGHIETPMSRRSAREREALGLGQGDALARIPLGRSSTPQELAGLALFLCSDEANYMTGQAVNFSGGLEMR